MPRSSSPYLFEELTGEIVFSHLTASICQCIVLPKLHHRSRIFFSNNKESRLVFDLTKQMLSIDQHPYTRFEQLETDLCFRFRFNESLRLNIPPSLKEDLFIIGN
ncbi:unnamed protein product [Adineta ricciae]|uniref:Uncharacterized protein n=1 Tax=Adineta ricciae TaxID=249248 RepID=A0A815NQ57_ADIRI|nr:unnamed protein product [Adineta ricciae]CAF1441107.1 unnamed protein product [Adineta ricciae]